MPLDVKLFGYYPGAHCPTCNKFHDCGGKAHQWDFESIKARLIERFGDRVSVSLINVFSGDVKMNPKIVEHIKVYGLRIPILMLEDEIIVWGGEAADDNIIKIVDFALVEKAKEEAAAAGQ
jgi:hypothetical protein